MKYSISQLATLSGITRRTLHHYDAIGLLVPKRNPANDYRWYGEREVLRLQQILLYRELGFELRKIQTILEDRDFSPIETLREHLQALRQKHHHIATVIQTVERTITALERKDDMSNVNLFDGFDPGKQEEYAKEAASRWGSELVEESNQCWNNKSKQEQQSILQEGEDIYKTLAALIGTPVDTDKVREQVRRWHQHIRQFYEPSIEVMEGLGQLYCADARFRETFDRIDTRLADYLNEAISGYCKRLRKYSAPSSDS